MMQLNWRGVVLVAALCTGCTEPRDCSLEPVLATMVDPAGVDCGEAAAGTGPNPAYDTVRSCIASALASGSSFTAHLRWDGDKFLLRNPEGTFTLTWSHDIDAAGVDRAVWVRQQCDSLVDIGMCTSDARDTQGNWVYGSFCYGCSSSRPMERCAEGEE